ncbi:hypothetical protein PCAR4_290018 [Paraburkholderia caribensis]|nr:hypothetical protein PCAR4_290018 [Paraburkholderia caribensis]
MVTVLVAQIYGLERRGLTSRWYTKGGDPVYLAVRYGAEAQIYIPTSLPRHAIVAHVLHDGRVEEVFNGNGTKLLEARSSPRFGNKSIDSLRAVLHEKGVIDAFGDTRKDDPWTVPPDERFDVKNDGGRSGGDGGDGGGNNLPPNGPVPGAGGVGEVMDHPVLFSSDRDFLADLLSNL